MAANPVLMAQVDVVMILLLATLVSSQHANRIIGETDDASRFEIESSDPLDPTLAQGDMPRSIVVEVTRDELRLQGKRVSLAELGDLTRDSISETPGIACRLVVHRGPSNFRITQVQSVISRAGCGTLVIEDQGNPR